MLAFDCTFSKEKTADGKFKSVINHVTAQNPTHGADISTGVKTEPVDN